MRGFCGISTRNFLEFGKVFEGFFGFFRKFFILVKNSYFLRDLCGLP